MNSNKLSIQQHWQRRHREHSRNSFFYNKIDNPLLYYDDMVWIVRFGDLTVNEFTRQIFQSIGRQMFNKSNRVFPRNSSLKIF